MLERLFQTNPTISLTRASMKIWFRDRQAIFWTFFLPLVLISVFGLLDIGAFRTVDLGIIDQADSEQFEGQRRSTRYYAMGNEYLKLLMELTEPQIVLCGHMHKKYRNKITLGNGKEVQVVCMAHVLQGWDSISFFTINVNNKIELFSD